jgi:hypothetical protein
MPLRTLFSVFTDDKKHVQALVQSMPRSFKMHVWASYHNIITLETIELKYIGTIQPIDQSDSLEIEELVRKLVIKELVNDTTGS